MIKALPSHTADDQNGEVASEEFMEGILYHKKPPADAPRDGILNCRASTLIGKVIRVRIVASFCFILFVLFVFDALQVLMRMWCLAIIIGKRCSSFEGQKGSAVVQSTPTFFGQIAVSST
jgi:hypothetical protein